MASIISNYHKIIPSKTASSVIQWSLEARRAMIMFRRIKNVSEATDVKIFGTFAPNTSDHKELTPYRDQLKETREKNTISDSAPNSSIHSNFSSNSQVGNKFELQDGISIIDIDAIGYDKGYKEIKLPFVPKELDVNPKSSFMAIRPIGSNRPFYHYTGSEDTLEFEIDWYAFDGKRQQVIAQCRELEALSKSDVDTGLIHRVQLIWGNGNELFGNHYFIITAAPYKLSNFNKGYINSKGELVNTNMLPIQAYQKVTLNRISSEDLPSVEVQISTETSLTRSSSIAPPSSAINTD